MKSITLLTLVAAAAVDAAAQTTTVSGLVVDQNANPRSGITVVYNRIPVSYTHLFTTPPTVRCWATEYARSPAP